MEARFSKTRWQCLDARRSSLGYLSPAHGFDMYPISSRQLQRFPVNRLSARGSMSSITRKGSSPMRKGSLEISSCAGAIMLTGLAVSTRAAVTVDGQRDGDYGSALAVQTN